MRGTPNPVCFNPPGDLMWYHFIILFCRSGHRGPERRGHVSEVTLVRFGDEVLLSSLMGRLRPPSLEASRWLNHVA